MQFGTLTWILDVFAFISAWHFNMAAASHCSCFSQCVGRGQGSAAGAAEDHMTCMLDALNCMGVMVRLQKYVHNLLCAMWYFRIFAFAFQPGILTWL